MLTFRESGYARIKGHLEMAMTCCVDAELMKKINFRLEELDAEMWDCFQDEDESEYDIKLFN